MELHSKNPHTIPQKCPVCEATHEQLITEPISASFDKMKIHVSCTLCNSALMIFVSQSEAGAVSFGVMVDVSREEAADVFSKDPISEAEVLQVHDQLSNRQNTKVSDLIPS